MGGMGTSQQTQDTSQNSINSALTDQMSLSQGFQQSNSNTLQNQMQATSQANNQFTNQFTNQNTNQATNQLQSSGQAQASTTNPWEAAMPTVQSLMGQLNPMIGNSGTTPGMSAAFDKLSTNYSAGNPYAPQIGAVTGNMLAGGGATNQAGAVNQNYLDYQKRLAPTADGADMGANAGLQPYLDRIRSDVTNQINPMFAAAGRDFSGANFQALGRGIAEGQAPVIAAQYNTDKANQRSAADAIYGGGNTTAGLQSEFQRMLNANQQAGIGNVPAALDAGNYGATQQLALEQMRQRLPVENLGLLANIGVPLARLGSTTSGTAQGVASNTGNVTGNTTGSTVGNTVGNTSGLMSAMNAGSTNANSMNATLGQAISSLLANASSTGKTRGTSTKSPLDQISQGVGILTTLMSDRRLKEDIQQVGTLFDGTPVYRYRYIGQPAFQIGLMAQDVEKTRPEAVAEVGGYKAVDYKLATDNAIAEAA